MKRLKLIEKLSGYNVANRGFDREWLKEKIIFW